MVPITIALALALAGQAVERDDVVIHVLTPDDASSKGRAKRLFDTAAAAIVPRTSLRPVTPDAAKITVAEVAQCTKSRRLGCWATAARSAPYVLLLSIQDPNAARPQLTALLIDVAEAARVERSIDPFEKDRAVAVEDAIYERAAVLRSERGAVDTFFTATFDALRARFERTKHWRPSGVLAIETTVAGLDVVLNEAIIGRTIPPVTTISDVATGSHVITLVDPEERYEKLVTDVTIDLGAQTRVTPTLVQSAKSARTIRTVTAWSGVAVATVGAAVTLLSFTLESDAQTVEPCVDMVCAEADATFQSAGGVLVAPLGYSLIATGAAWSGGTWLLTDELEIPWLSIAIGVVLGGAAYGISAAAGG